ncbi:MAG: carbon-nitrogen hydrolase family protein [Opitutaceae bacterium]|nr:carbon-nitrogen hydrolase family protein [Opitutaceae bacterium]
MQKFKIATVQMNALKDDLQHNLDVHVRFIEQAAGAGCALVSFPETSATAHYGSPEVNKFAEPAGAGPVYRTLAEQAKRHGIVVAYGFAEEARGTYYNAHALVGPAGLIGIQRKVHSSGDEYYVFRMGRSFEVFDLGFCRVGTLICYDSIFSESWRVLALKGAELILAPHAGRKGGKDRRVPPEGQLENLRQHREQMPGPWGVFAAENGVFCGHCGQWGFNGHSTHKGGACVVDPLGRMIAQGPLQLEDLMITAELDPAVQQEARARSGYTLRTRRPEMYGELTRLE